MSDAKAYHCAICKHLKMLNIEVPPPTKELHTSKIFDENGKEQQTGLCYHHHIELFRSGQMKFAQTYGYLVEQFVGSDELDFLEMMYDYYKTLNRGRI